MVTYIFYCIIIVCILSSLIKRKLKNFIGRKKRYRRKRARNRHSVMQIMTAKVTTLRTLYVHVVSNSVMFPEIVYHIVLHAQHFLPVKFFVRATAKCNVDR